MKPQPGDTWEKVETWGRETFFADDDYIGGKTPFGGVFLKIRGHILWVVVDGEASGEDLTNCFTKALDAGWLMLSMPALIDVTRFTGAVDWAAIRAVSEMAAWGRSRSHELRVAYLVRDDGFGALVKIVSALFPWSEHRAFVDLPDALGWLHAAGSRGCAS